MGRGVVRRVCGYGIGEWLWNHSGFVILYALHFTSHQIMLTIQQAASESDDSVWRYVG